MKEIFQTYVDNAFGEYEQADFKFVQFENNYRKFFPLNRDATLLDIGVGRGEMLSCMERWGFENYLGIDISPSTINFCKSIGLKCELVESTIEWLADKKEQYNLITLLDVLEHVKKEETIQFLQSLHSALSPQGTLLIQVPNMQAPDSQLHRYNDFTHEVGYVEHTLRQVLVCAGFADITCYGFEEMLATGFGRWKQTVIRNQYWRFVRYVRQLCDNLNPEILHPVFYALVKK